MERINGLSFTVLYDLDAEEVARKIGAFYEHRRHIIQPFAFILQWGKIVNATYSNGPVGRLSPSDALALIRHLRNRPATD
ncbi:hypothetical protein DESUT3_09710 [Desulfuromonas versatilis]|uniref:Alkyl hydroperoxide reductase subunit C/ Thiol specific antioxidant domain-containing protein n=1 Tax=Desulfuromonas versatilis TaxID=2802975 RepID=A0ABM8HQ86_9BACT|nr:hypothetical protein DESUT3_09710 [Desulfuromonas versatilis]